MARKEKCHLPSGSIRIQRKVGTRPDGSRIMKSFTGATKDEAKYKWRQYMLSPHHEEVKKKASLSVCEAVERYIDMKRSVLSPATIRGYQGILRTHLGGHFGSIDINNLRNADVQLWVSDLAEDHSPKTVRNASALVQSAVEMFRPEFHYKVTLPQPVKADLYCPSDKDVRQLLDAIDDKELRIAVLLAAFGPLRRSEICALTSADIQGNTVTVNKALVKDDSGAFVLKTTKTVSSTRRIQMPDFVIREMSGIQGRIISCTPNAISARYEKALRKSGCPRFRFHDLRHYAASIMHAIGVPDQYIMSRGGWATDNVMKRVYRNVIELEEVKQTRKITEHFQKVSHV